jgi:hypothetical protein
LFEYQNIKPDIMKTSIKGLTRGTKAIILKIKDNIRFISVYLNI